MPSQFPTVTDFQTWTIPSISTPEQIEEIRRELGYDRPFITRYLAFLGDLASGDLGLSDANGEDVARLLGRTTPVTLALVLPGFLLGNLLGLALGMLAAWRRGSLLDRLIMGGSVVGMSLSFLVIIIGLQVLLCTPAVRNIIREGRTFEIPNVIETNRALGMRSLDASIAELYFNGMISRDDAIAQAAFPDKLDKQLAA